VTVSRRFEELDWQRTPRGDISLRRRHDPVLDLEVYEVLLGDEYLMSSAFTMGEEELARLALARVSDHDIDVVVGGLGLGYTARAVLADPRVRTVHVVDALAEVIGWHERRLLPLAGALLDDGRCRLVHGDFFGGLDAPSAWGTDVPPRLHAIIVDIDHSPRHLLDAASATFYKAAAAWSSEGGAPFVRSRPSSSRNWKPSVLS